MQKTKKSPVLVVAIAFLFVLGISFAGFSSALKRMNVHIASADDQEDGQKVEEHDSEDNNKVEEDDNKDEEDSKDENDSEDDTKEVRQARTSEVRTRATVVRHEEENQDNHEENDSEDDSVKDVTEETQDLNKEVTKLEIKISAAADSGVDVTAFRSALAEIKDLVAQVQAKIDSNDATGTKALLETIDDKKDALKDSLDKVFESEEADDQNEAGDDIEGHVAKEYKNSVAQFVHTLKAIGEREGGIGQQVRVVAQAQNDSQAKIEDAITSVGERGGFLQFLIGADYGKIKEIRSEIAENQNRINVLTQLLGQITDQATKDVLQAQIQKLQQENTQLQAFATASENKPSVFGWLVRLFQ